MDCTEGSMNLEENGNVGTQVEEGKNPLKNPLILDHVFKYLSLKDIKSCRGVCKLWNEISTSMMEKMSLVTLYPDSANTSQAEAKTPMAFKEFSQNSGICFDSFKLKSNLIFGSKWSRLALSKFFEDQRQNIKELTIDNMNVAAIWRFSDGQMYFLDSISGRMRSDYRYFSLDSYIENNLTHLAIDNTFGSKFAVSSDKLVQAKTILLRSCSLKVTNCKLAPEKLEMSLVAVLKGDYVVEQFALNELYDFKNLKELTLDGDPTFRPDWCFHGIWYHYKTSKLTIKTKKMSLNKLNLKSVIIEDMENSEWQINGLVKLRKVPFENYTKINFTEMDFGDSTINLAALPLSLEKLILCELENETTKVICPEYPLLTLPNLKYLEILIHSGPFYTIYRVSAEARDIFDEGELRFGENFLYHLTFFAHCQNLTTLKLVCTCEDANICLGTSWIPPQIKHLTLVGDIKTIGKEIRIEKLVLRNDYLGNIATCVNKLQSEHLVLDLYSEEVDHKDVDYFLVHLIRKLYKTLAIGSLTINPLDFQKSSFSNFVDNIAENYLFENGIGRAIEKVEFEKLKEEN